MLLASYLFDNIWSKKCEANDPTYVTFADRIALADSLFNLLDSRYMETLTRGFESVRPMWERYSALTGKRVAIVVGDRRESGVVVGIDAGGALLLDIGERVERIVAGEVSVEGAYE